MIHTAAWAVLSLFAPALAGAYEFPYPDPYYATITAAILKADHLDQSLTYQDLPLRLLPERDEVPYFGRTRNKITIRLWQQPVKAPLVILIAGLGGGASATYNNFLASHFLKKGFHVLAFPSPFHWTFALAGSRSALPGITREDSQDLYKALEAGIEKIKAAGVQLSGLGLLGVSMGALEAAYLSAIDAEEGRLGFQKVLLINPPVDPAFSGTALDRLEEKGKGFTAVRRKDLQERVYLFGSKTLILGDIKSPGYFLGLEQNLPTTVEERQFLIGSSLKTFLQSLVFATQQVHDLGVLPGPPSKENLDQRLRASAGFSFQDYLIKILLPGLAKQKGRQIGMEELKADVLFSGVESHLRASRHVFLMHNQDDFIVNQEQLGYLKNVFGERMLLYPHGGHVGNIWFPENLAYILETFAPLHSER